MNRYDPRPPQSIPETLADPPTAFTVDEARRFKKQAGSLRKQHEMTAPDFLGWAAQIVDRRLRSLDHLNRDEWELVLKTMRENVPPETNVQILRFNINLWNKAANLPDDFKVPPYAHLRLIVDPSYPDIDADDIQGSNTPDHSGFAVGYVEKEYRESDSGREVILLYAQSGWYVGQKLPQEIARLADFWRVTEIEIERSNVHPRKIAL